MVLLSLLLPSVAHAADWKKSLPPQSVASYLDRADARILVAGSGDLGAADALRTALRASGRTKVVMDASAIGSVAGLDDKSIVARCASLPLDLVMVVRAFPGATADTPSAVVTIFDKQAKVLAAFTAEAGTPLARRSANASGGEGVSSEAAGAVSRTLHENREAPSEGQKEYDEKFVGFIGITGINQYGSVVGQWTQPFQGKYQRALDIPEFYEAVDQPDTAVEYRHKSHIKSALTIPGSILTGAGGLTALITGMLYALDGIGSSCDPHYENCASKADKRDLELQITLVGAGAAAVGIGLLVGSAFVHRPELTPEQARQLADQHNQRLRARLGLPAEESHASREETPAIRKAPRRSLALAPSLTAKGAGLSLALTF